MPARYRWSPAAALGAALSRNGPRAVRRRGIGLATSAVLVLLVAVGVVQVLRGGDPRPAVPAAAVAPPPPAAGYLRLLPPGSFATLPDDANAARSVYRSGWEVRPGNDAFNRTEPPALALDRPDPAAKAYDPRWSEHILSRITGRFSGTTDEIFQWAAAKWGLPDNLLRTLAFVESHWTQTKNGDHVDDQASCPSGYRAPCPVTFGIVGTKSTSFPGAFPWNRDSTAASVDIAAGWLRGCYEGWVWWLRDHGTRVAGTYAAGDIWGCVGAWASGDWHDTTRSPLSGEAYLRHAQQVYAQRPWLDRGF